LIPQIPQIPLHSRGSYKVHPRFAFKRSYLLLRFMSCKYCKYWPFKRLSPLPPLLPLHSRVLKTLATEENTGHRTAFKRSSSRGEPARRLHFVYTGGAGFLPLAVASPLTPALALGFLFGGNLFDPLYKYLCPWVLWVKPPVRMALLDLSVVLVDQSLHQVEDQ
jgi:hypothetical protein